MDARDRTNKVGGYAGEVTIEKRIESSFEAYLFSAPGRNLIMRLRRSRCNAVSGIASDRARAAVGYGNIDLE